MFLVMQIIPICIKEFFRYDRFMHENEKVSETIRVALSADTLRRLLDVNALCATEFHCLDCDSKRCVWKLLLSASASHCTDENSFAPLVTD